jgi:hypothetical protein
MNAVGELGTLADQVRPTGTIIQFYKPIEGQLFTTTNYRPTTPRTPLGRL